MSFEHRYHKASKRKRMFVSYHPYKSTGLGGVEVLLRNLQLLFESDFQWVEVFHYSSESGEIYPPNNKIKYLKMHFSPIILLIKKFFLPARISQHVKFVAAAARAAGICRKGDIYLSFNPWNALFFCLLRRRGVPCIYVQINSVEVLAGRKIGRLVFRFAMKFVDYITVYTEFDKRELADAADASTEKIYIIPRGCKLPVSTEIRKCSKKLVTIARIDEKQKNFMAMMEIMRNLPKEYSLTIYGSGSEYELNALKQMIMNYPNVRYRGVALDVAEALRGFGIFLMTSRFEGFGQSLTEARSQGLPIIAFDTFPALHWIVRDSVNGYIVQPFDTNSFCRKVIDITASDSQYQKFSEAALAQAHETDEAFINGLWTSLVDKVIASEQERQT